MTDKNNIRVGKLGNRPGRAPLPEDRSSKAPLPEDRSGKAPLPEDCSGKGQLPENGSNETANPQKGTGQEPVAEKRVMHRNKNYCPQCGKRYNANDSECSHCHHPREILKTW